MSGPPFMLFGVMVQSLTLMQIQVTGTAESVDYTQCPLPKTHRRLVEAHILWHQTLESYQETEAFRANLNALIQALRHATFILKTEKHSFRDFDDWYLPWQKRLELDVVSVWVKGARTTIVHQGELDGDSTAIVKLVTWRDHLLFESSVPPTVPSSLIVRNLDLIQALNNVQVRPADLKTAALLVERRWVVGELKDREILDGLAQAYGLLASLVLDAHVHLMNTRCILTEQRHSHFPSLHDRTGTLPCMAMGSEVRTGRFDLETRREFRLSQGPVVARERETAAARKRYGFGDSDRIAQWQGMDPVLMAKKIGYLAKRMLSRDKALARVIHFRDGRGQWHLVELDASNKLEQYLLMRMVARLVETTGADALIDVGEIWLVPENGVKHESRDVDSLEQVKGRREAMKVLVATRGGVLQIEITEFKKGGFGGIKFGETRQMKEGQILYLQPVFEVWRRQGFRKLVDGRTFPRIWEPDLLDTCFCGGPKRFGECCARFLNDELAKRDLEKALGAAQEAGDFEQAEMLARAALAQYVIWAKQHTAMFMNGAPEFYRDWVAIDAPALDELMARLHRLMIKNQHAAHLLPQLRHISTVIGVPELSVRVKSRVAQLLFDSGEYSRAGEELRRLGDLDQVNDTLALVLASKVFELPAAKAIEILRRAVARAFTDEERWFSQVQLISYLIECDQPADALALIDSLASECRDKEGAQNTLLIALSLRAEITRDPKDCETARQKFETFKAPEERQQLAIMLIERGEISEAEAILSEAVTLGEPLAQLITIDARRRSGRIDSAHELLRSVDQTAITDRLRYPYAVTYVHVAAATGDERLKSRAAELLREVPSVGTRVAAEVSGLLKALAGNGGSSRRPRWALVRNLLNRI